MAYLYPFAEERPESRGDALIGLRKALIVNSRRIKNNLKLSAIVGLVGGAFTYSGLKISENEHPLRYSLIVLGGVALVSLSRAGYNYFENRKIEERKNELEKKVQQSRGDSL